MGNINADIKSVKQMLEENMQIPPYQRPYRWSHKNVKQLLEDIAANMNAGKRAYRIGSVILYKNKDEVHEIVDGQQRITTLLLLAKACGVENELLGKLE